MPYFTEEFREILDQYEDPEGFSLFKYQKQYDKVGKPFPDTKRKQIKGKARFECDCGNVWTSSKSHVVFFYKIARASGRYLYDYYYYNQQCKFCDTWIGAWWYDSEIERIINELINLLTNTNKSNRNQRGANPKANHDSARCEACKLKVCELASPPNKRKRQSRTSLYDI